MTSDTTNTAKKIRISVMTATIIEINLLDALFIRKKYRHLIHKKKIDMELIALSVSGKSYKNSTIMPPVISE